MCLSPLRSMPSATDGGIVLPGWGYPTPSLSNAEPVFQTERLYASYLASFHLQLLTTQPFFFCPVSLACFIAFGAGFDLLPGGTERQCSGGQGGQRKAELVRRRHRHRRPRQDHPRAQRSAREKRSHSQAGHKSTAFVAEPGRWAVRACTRKPVHHGTHTKRHAPLPRVWRRLVASPACTGRGTRSVRRRMHTYATPTAPCVIACAAVRDTIYTTKRHALTVVRVRASSWVNCRWIVSKYIFLSCFLTASTGVRHETPALRPTTSQKRNRHAHVRAWQAWIRFCSLWEAEMGASA